MATSSISSEAKEIVQEFGVFLRRYYKDEMGTLGQRYPKDQKSLQVDWKKLHQFNPRLADDLLKHPDEIIECFEEAIRLHDLPLDITLSQAHVRVGGIEDGKTHYPGEYSPSEIVNEYRAFRGKIVKLTDVKPKIQEAAFECQRCGTNTYIPQAGGSFQEPHECDGCERQGPFRINFEESEFVDGQKLRLQTPPNIAQGAGSHIDIYVEDDLCDVAQAGDSVTVSGILKIEDKTGNKSKESLAFDIYVVAKRIEFDEDDPTDETISSEDRKEIQAIADGKLGDPLTAAGQSLAPGIFGHEKEKQSLVLAAVGGAQESFEGTQDRGNFHILMIGDPGTAKSQLGNHVAKVAPRSVSVDSSEAGKAGLTASAVQDDFAENGNKWSLEAGAAVQADRGLLWVDELDDMADQKKASLTTPMSKQEISVSKAGINADLSTRCAVILAANPKHGNFDEHEPIVQQFDLESNLISRCDLVWVFTDKLDEELDTNIADHVLTDRDLKKRKHRGLEVDENVAEGVEPPISEELLSKYIVLAREQPDPVFESKQVKKKLKAHYLQLRGAYGRDPDEPVPITHRKLGAVIRVAESVAKFYFSDVITEEHAKRTIQLVEDSMRQYAIDENGKFDSSIYESGKSKTQEDRKKLVIETMLELEEQYDETGCPKNILLNVLTEEIGQQSARSELEYFLERGMAYEPEQGWIRCVEEL